jgi:uncharacterized protein (TIRG00374 family)
VSTNRKNFKAAQAILFFALGVFLIFYFWNTLTEKEQHDIIQNFYSTHLIGIVLPLLAGILSHIFRALRWNMLMETVGIQTRLGESFWAVMVGYLFNLAIPRLGELMRCVFLSRKKKQPLDSILGTMISERMFDLLWYALLFIISLFIFMGTVNEYVTQYGTMFVNSLTTKWQHWLVGLILLLLLVWLTMYILRKRKPTSWEKIRFFLKNILNGMLAIFKLKRWYLFLLYTIFIWIMYWLMIYLAYLSLRTTAGLSPESAFVVLIFATLGIMVIQGGIGIYPIIVAEILQLYHLPRVDGYALGWITWTVQTLLVIVLGLVGLLYFSLNKKYEKQGKDIAKD